MTIKSYTFDSSDNINSKQLRPYSSKVDARVRRDLFNGVGNLIFTAPDGNMLDNSTHLNVRGSTTKSVTFFDATAFTAGGRLFSINEPVTIRFESTSVRNVYVGYFTVDVDTEATDGEYVKITTSARYQTDDFESARFSAEYTVLLVSTSSDRDYLFPAPQHAARTAAGSMFALQNSKETYDDYDIMRGCLSYGSNVSDTLVGFQSGKRFSFHGLAKIVKVGNSLYFLPRIGSPVSLVGSGQIIIDAEGYRAIASITDAPVSPSLPSYCFKVDNIHILEGSINNNQHRAYVSANITGAWKILK